MGNLLFLNEESPLNKCPHWLRKILAVLAVLSLLLVLTLAVKTYIFSVTDYTGTDSIIEDGGPDPVAGGGENKNAPAVVVGAEETSDLEAVCLPYYNGYSWAKQGGVWYPVDETGTILLKDILDKGFIRPGSIFEDGVAASARTVNGDW